jgi:hypothetical protein
MEMDLQLCNMLLGILVMRGGILKLVKMMAANVRSLGFDKQVQSWLVILCDKFFDLVLGGNPLVTPANMSNVPLMKLSMWLCTH